VVKQIKNKNKWVNGLIPVLLMSFATGSVYCWTLFVDRIEAHSEVFTPAILAWCFSLALFCLGISAALGGKLVERDIKKASLYTFIFFTLGWLLTGVAVYIESPLLAIIGFGPIQGVGLGLGYLAPVKTLMMWFHEQKGLAAGIAIAAFGLSGVFGNPLIEAFLQSGINVYHAFYILTVIYGVACFIAYVLIERPELAGEAVESEAHTKTYSLAEIVLNKKFILLWFVLFINIACGLAIIGNERQIYLTLGLTNDTMIVMFTSLNAFSNLIGRVICGAAQDRTDKKYLPYYVMTVASMIICGAAMFLYFGAGTTMMTALTVATVFGIQFFFGCGFACLPNILEQEYGMKQLATIQGYMLTAWAVAGLVGNQISTFIIDRENPGSLNIMYGVLGALYLVQLVVLVGWVKSRNKASAAATMEVPSHVAVAK